MRDWLGVGDSRSWDDEYSVYAVLSVCCTWYMLYSVYGVLGVNSWSWLGEIETDHLTSCSWVMVEKERDEEDMWEIIIRNWDLWEFCVRVNFPFLRGPVLLPIRGVKTPVQGPLDPIRHVVPMTSHIRLYPPYHSHFHPPSLFLSYHCRTQR
jgi:hypothetical protein